MAGERPPQLIKDYYESGSISSEFFHEFLREIRAGGTLESRAKRALNRAILG
jgi:hypothetical protein